MDSEQFKAAAADMATYCAEYLDGIRERRVFPAVEQGYLAPLMPRRAPEEGESWEAILPDVERLVMPGVTHWHHPNFHAYYPTANSYPSVLADMLSDTIACIGFTWASSPACTELEMVMMDWLADAIGLPEHFKFQPNPASVGVKEDRKQPESFGGGVIHGTASEATLVAMLAARNAALATLAPAPSCDSENATEEGDFAPPADTQCWRLAAFCNEQAHSSVERAAMLAGVRCFKVGADARTGAMSADALATAMRRATSSGWLPFFVCATLGTTNTCAFDDLADIGVMLEEVKENRKEGEVPVWLHVDAAYAGSSFVCPEYRIDGLQYIDSFNFNPHKWLQVTFDCSTTWFRDRRGLTEAFSVDPVYLRHRYSAAASTADYRHWQIPLGRRFRALKVWFVLRLFGLERLRAQVRDDCRKALLFADLLKEDDRFEITDDVRRGLVVFRLKTDGNTATEALLKAVEAEAKIHMVPCVVAGQFRLRFAVCATRTTDNDIRFAWGVIRRHADAMVTTSTSSAG